MQKNLLAVVFLLSQFVSHYPTLFRFIFRSMCDFFGGGVATFSYGANFGLPQPKNVFLTYK